MSPKARFKPYPRYKPSSVEWLGDVPEGWDIMRLKFVSSIGTGDKDTVNNVLEGQYPFFVRSQTIERINSYSYDGEAVLTAGDGVGVAKVFHYVDGKFDFHQRVYKFSDFNHVIGKFFFYYIREMFREEVLKLSAKSTVDSLRLPMIQNFMFCIPTLNEQIALVKFIESETARIDRLVGHKERLIELLQEKRTALISEMVCGKRSLIRDPKDGELKAVAPAELSRIKKRHPEAVIVDATRTKSSGVEWLGDVPEEWAVKRLRYLGRCQNGINIGAEYFGTGYPFVSYGNVYNNRELPNKVEGLVQSSDSDRKHYSVKEGDVLFTRTSETIEEVGFASTCFHSIVDATFAGFLIRFRPLHGALNTHFSKYYFQNILLRAFFVKEMNLVTRASLSQDLLKQMPVLIPQLEAQATIADFLDCETDKLDKLTTKIQEAIGKLKEYRTALISAAVTGKIDVRGEK